MLASKATAVYGSRAVRLAHLVFALSALSACEVPEAPQWDVGLRVPFSTDPISIADFLPADVSIDTVGGAAVFVVSLQTDGESYTLAQLCGTPCVSLNGTMAPVPAFSYNDSIDVAFDPDLVSIEVITARLGVTLNNGLNFDPLRPHPNPDSAGSIALITRDVATGALLDSTLLSGATRTLPPNDTIQLDIILSNVEIRGGLRTHVVVNSPFDGQSALIDTGMSAGFGVALDEIAVSAITAVVDSTQLDERFVLDVDADLRQDLADRVQSGEFELEVMHDIEIAGNLEVSIAASLADLFSGLPGAEVRLADFDFSFAPAGRTMKRVLTPEDIEFIAMQPSLFVGYRANASGSSIDAGRPVARITPDQSIVTRLKVTTQVRVGS